MNNNYTFFEGGVSTATLRPPLRKARRAARKAGPHSLWRGRQSIS